MPKPPRWHPPVAITRSRLLRDELRLCEQHAGTEFAYPTTIPQARREARYAPMLVIGVDQAGLIRMPIRCRTGLVFIATIEPDDRRAAELIERIGARCVIILPTAREFVVDKLLHPTRDREDVAGATNQ